MKKPKAVDSCRMWLQDMFVIINKNSSLLLIMRCYVGSLRRFILFQHKFIIGLRKENIDIDFTTFFYKSSKN